ncbi:unnamed protein product [Diamesa tonsa]
MFSIKLLFVFSALLVVLVNCDPTMYKKNEQNVYEADLVAFSSTVIPESEMKSEELTAKMDMEYKKAFYGLFKKKFNSKLEKADTLMTDKKKFDKNPEKNASKKLR